MSIKILKSLFIIASTGLAVAALIFVILAISGRMEREWFIPVGLGCAGLGSLFNLVRIYLTEERA